MKRTRLAWSGVDHATGRRSAATGGRAKNSCRGTEQEPEDHRADDRAEHPGRATEEQHRVGEERHVGREHCGLNGGCAGEKMPAKRAEDAAEDQRLHLVGVDVLAEARTASSSSRMPLSTRPHGLRISSQTMRQHSATSVHPTTITQKSYGRH